MEVVEKQELVRFRGREYRVKRSFSLNLRAVEAFWKKYLAIGSQLLSREGMETLPKDEQDDHKEEVKVSA